MTDSNKIYVKEDDGSEKEMEILFTIEDYNDKDYVLFTDPSDEDGEVFACAYNEDGSMVPVEDEAELQMIDEVFNAFMDEFENEEE